MSADSYSTCPQCLIQAKAEYAAAEEYADKSYGEVSAEEYEQIRDDADQPFEAEEENLREDYEFDISETGKFTALYKARCVDCDFSFAFEHEEQIELRELLD